MDIEVYLPMIMCRQIPWEYEDEMFKVQAVLARSSLYFSMENGETDDRKLREEWKKFQSEPKDQKFYKTYDRMEEAVKLTRGQVITYKGNVCPGTFHRISSGITREGKEIFEDESMRYLHSVNSSADLAAENYMTRNIVGKKEFCIRAEKYYPECGVEETHLMEQLCIEKRDTCGYVTEVRVGDRIVPGEEFRKIFGLSSGNFFIQDQNENIRFLCKGLGHGLGLSQYGGNEMAKSGNDYKQILFSYFPDVALRTKVSEK